MTPLDDELRTALRGRADALAPAADPLAGIESRARRIQRRRGAAAVLGTTLAVALVAVAVPAVIGSTTSSTAPQDFASPTAVVQSDRPANAVDWPVVGGSSQLDTDARAEWGRVHDARPVSGEVLFRGRTSDDREVVLLQLWASGVRAHAVIATTGEEAPLLLVDQEALPGINGYRAIVPGAATPHVVVVGAPGNTSVAYAADGSSFVEQASARSAVFRRTGPTGAVPDQVRTTDRGGFTYDQPADPDLSDGGPGAGEPANAVDWPARGETPSTSIVADAKKGFALALGRLADLEGVQYKVLFAGSTDGGLRYVLGQAWFAGDTTAYPVGFYADGEQGSEPFVGRPTAVGAKVLAFVPCCSPGLTVDQLVVIPAPGAGQVQYGAASSEWRDVGAGQEYLDGVVIIDRDARDQDDRLRVLDGDGDLDGPFLYEGPVQPLLCGVKECG